MERSRGLVAIGVVLLLCAGLKGAEGDVVEVGDEVEVRNAYDQPWQRGKVTEVAPIKVDVNGALTSPFFIKKVGPKARKLSSDIQIGDAVKIRNAADQPWQHGIVTQVAPIKVQVNGATTSPFFIKKAGSTDSRKLFESFQVGEHVQIRNGLDQSWKQGIVTQVSPLTVEVDGQQSSPFFVRKVSSNVRRLSDDIHVGDVVEVRNGLDQQWHQAEVIQIAPIKVKVDGATTSPLFIRKASASRRLSIDFAVGDKVKVRDNLDEDWQEGKVTQVAPLMVDVDGEQSSPIFVEKITDDGDRRNSRKLSSIDVGDVVKVRDALDQPWRQGTVTQVAPIKVEVNGAETSPFFIKKLADARKLSTFPVGAESEQVGEDTSEFVVGDVVEVQSSLDGAWTQGILIHLTPFQVQI